MMNRICYIIPRLKVIGCLVPEKRDYYHIWVWQSPYGKAVFVRISDEYAANILRSALFTLTVSDKKVIAE